MIQVNRPCEEYQTNYTSMAAPKTCAGDGMVRRCRQQPLTGKPEAGAHEPKTHILREAAAYQRLLADLKPGR